MAAAALVNILRNVVPTPLYYSSTTAMKVKSIPLNSTHVSVQQHSVCRGVHDVVAQCARLSGNIWAGEIKAGRLAEGYMAPTWVRQH